jgi:hypothetical protein
MDIYASVTPCSISSTESVLALPVIPSARRVAFGAVIAGGTPLDDAVAFAQWRAAAATVHHLAAMLRGRTRPEAVAAGITFDEQGHEPLRPTWIGWDDGQWVCNSKVAWSGEAFELQGVPVSPPGAPPTIWPVGSRGRRATSRSAPND